MTERRNISKFWNKVKSTTADVVSIIDPASGKKLNVKNLHIIFHTVPKKNGNLKKEKCVEFIVIGKNREWEYWAFYEDFVKFNPEIKIEK